MTVIKNYSKNSREPSLPQAGAEDPSGRPSSMGWYLSWVSNYGEYLAKGGWGWTRGRPRQRKQLHKGKERWKTWMLAWGKDLGKAQWTCHVFCGWLQPLEVASETSLCSCTRTFRSWHPLTFLHWRKGSNILVLCIMDSQGKKKIYECWASQAKFLAVEMHPGLSVLLSV